MQTVAFCEIDPFCQKVLAKHWPNVPIFNDVRALDYDGTVDVICGGFPCQPFSVAGKRKGAEDDRHLWPAMLACIQKYRPHWVIGENVAGLINMGLDAVLSNLESEGYTCQAFVIPACAANAPHRRDRVWIIANRDGALQHTESCAGTDQRNGNGKIRQWAIADTAINAPHTNNWQCEGSVSKALQGFRRGARQFARGNPHVQNRWPVSAPRVCGVDDGVSNRTHRLRALGNAVVPQIPEIIGRAIMQCNAHKHTASNRGED